MSEAVKSTKPRRLKGTPSYRYRNHFATAVLLAGTAIFAGIYALTYNPSAEAKIRKFFENTEEDMERRELMSFLKQRRGEEIRKIMEETETFRREK